MSCLRTTQLPHVFLSAPAYLYSPGPLHILSFIPVSPPLWTISPMSSLSTTASARLARTTATTTSPSPPARNTTPTSWPVQQKPHGSPGFRPTPALRCGTPRLHLRSLHPSPLLLPLRLPFLLNVRKVSGNPFCMTRHHCRRPRQPLPSRNRASTGRTAKARK